MTNVSLNTPVILDANSTYLKDEDTPSYAAVTIGEKTLSKVRLLQKTIKEHKAGYMTVYSLPQLEVDWLNEDQQPWEDSDGIHLRDVVIYVYPEHIVYKKLTRDDAGEVTVRIDLH